jgi:hypothetical protein
MQATKHLVAWLLPLHSADVVKCGWLLKWRDAFPNRKWQRRLFVLRSDLTVRYYAEQKMGTIEERGEFDVRRPAARSDGKGNPDMRSRRRFAMPAPISHECSPCRGRHICRESLAFVRRLRAILRRSVPNPNPFTTHFEHSRRLKVIVVVLVSRWGSTSKR